MRITHSAVSGYEYFVPKRAMVTQDESRAVSADTHALAVHPDFQGAVLIILSATH